jgi:hypothetical protein
MLTCQQLQYNLQEMCLLNYASTSNAEPNEGVERMLIHEVAKFTYNVSVHKGKC